MHKPFYDPVIGYWVSFVAAYGKLFLFSCPSEHHALAIQSIAKDRDKHRLSYPDFVTVCGAFGRTFFVGKTK